MGLTGGIADIAGLVQCLEGMYKGDTDDSIFTTWSDVQRQKYHDIINPISSGNIRRLFDQDLEKVMETDEFLKMLKRAESDPELAQQIHKSGNNLNYDYSQHFRKQQNGTSAS